MNKILAVAVNVDRSVQLDNIISGGKLERGGVSLFVKGLAEGLMNGPDDAGTFDIEYMEHPPEGLAQAIRDALIKDTDKQIKVIFPISFHAVRAAQAATQDLPIIFPNISDPVEDGFVQSRAQPGTNVTGVCPMRRQTARDCLELFKAILPSLTTVYTLFTRGTLPAEAAIRELLEVAPLLGIDFEPILVKNPKDIAASIKPLKQTGTAASPRDGVLFVPDDLVMSTGRDVIRKAHSKGIPTFTFAVEFVNHGNLGSLGGYGIPRQEAGKAAAEYVDKVFRGVNPANIPAKFIGGFKFLINAVLAGKWGIDIPDGVKKAADTL